MRMCSAPLSKKALPARSQRMGRFIYRQALVWPLLMLLCFASQGCGRLEMEEEPAEKLVARAGDENLSVQSYNKNFAGAGARRDSAYVARKAIESWALEALFYQEAIDKLSAAELDVEHQVEEYRRSLINYAYQNRLVESNLDTVVSQEEVQQYYEDNRQNFILKENIVKVEYIKVPVQAPGLEKIRKLTGSDKKKDRDQLLTLCLQNAETFFMNDSTWLFVDAVRKEIPQLQDEEDYALVPGRVLEYTDDQYFYYLKVKDVKIKNALSPINFERGNIRKYILNKRKTQLLNRYKRGLLEKAKADKRFVIY
jgi:hypothetical protein